MIYINEVGREEMVVFLSRSILSNALTVILFLCWFRSILPNRIQLDCEKRAHSSLTHEQRKALCANAYEEYSVGPAACSIMAKDILHFKFDEMLKLCKESKSAAPVECVMKLESRLRGTPLAYDLCTRASTVFPSECFMQISLLRKSNKKIKDEQIIEFCKGMEDKAPMNCLMMSQNSTSLSLETAMSLCKAAIGSGDSSQHNVRNFMTSSCISALKESIQPSTASFDEDIVRFCVEINPLQYPHLISDSSEDIESFKNAATSCFQEINGLVASGNKLYSWLTVNHRLGICSNAPVALGPVNCTATVLENYKQKESQLSLTASDLVALCKGATNKGPADCFLESKGLGNVEQRTELCNSATNAVNSS